MTTENLRPVDFATLVPEYDKRFPMEMAVLRIGGVFPGEATQGLVDPYTNLVDTEYFGNVGEHCVAVANLSEILAKKVLGENDARVRGITSRGLMHDAAKRYEVMRKKAVKAGIIDMKDPYERSAYQTIKPLLEAHGLAPDIVDYMAEAGSETGHQSIPDFVELVDGNPVLITRDNLPEMIVHIADDMTSTPIVNEGETAVTTYMTFPQRAIASDFKNKYPKIYQQGFGFDGEGRIVYVEDVKEPHPELSHLRTNYEWQAWTAREISTFLVSRIAPDQVGNAEGYLKALANEALEPAN